MRQMTRQDVMWSWALACGAVLCGWCGAHQTPPGPVSALDGAPACPPRSGAAVGLRAPDFALYADDGRMYRLSRLRGRTVLLNFLCGCPRCAASAGDWERL